jgi:sugar/nucleoside kinase (ribokinase family)
MIRQLRHSPASRYKLGNSYFHKGRQCVCQSGKKSSGLVVGVGGVGIDYLASVLKFPIPDQKYRTERLEVQGGGNCGNALTGVSRLGIRTRVLSTIGKDALGDSVLEEFRQDEVDTEFLIRQDTASTPFTYIIVDESGLSGHGKIALLSQANTYQTQHYISEALYSHAFAFHVKCSDADGHNQIHHTVVRHEIALFL